MNEQATLLTRRNLLHRAVSIPAIAAVAGCPVSGLSAELAPIERVGGPHLKIGLNVFSFLELLTANAKDPATGVDLFAVCDFCAKQNIDAVDLTGYFFPGYPNGPADSYLYKLKRHIHGLGLTISGTGVRNDFATADKAVRAAGVKIARTWIEVAAKLGAPVIRLFAGPQPPHNTWQAAAGQAGREEVETWMADSLRECAEYGQACGVLVAVQNHGDFLSTGPEHLSLLKRVDHPWCGALVDTGKYLTDDPYQDIAMMVPHAVNWQIKETMRSSTDSPPTDFPKLVNVIRKGGYRGVLPIETLSMRRKDYDPHIEVVKVLTELRRAIAANA